MADESPVAGGATAAPTPPGCFGVVPSVGYLAGAPVYQPLGAGVAPAIASGSPSAANARLVGLGVTAGVAGQPSLVKSGGPLTLSVAQWNALTGGSTGLVRGDTYYVSGAAAGLLTSTKPTGGSTVVAIVGVALSATTMLIKREIYGAV